MPLRLLSVLACVVLLASAPVAVSPSQAPASSSSKRPVTNTVETVHATFSTVSKSTSLSAGARVWLYVDVTPKPSMHVYAPGEKENLPIALTIPKDPAYTLGVQSMPAPQKYVFPPLKLTQLVYGQPFRITQPLTLVKPLSTELKIAGSIRYQACDDAVCYFPKTVEVSWLLSAAPR